MSSIGRQYWTVTKNEASGVGWLRFRSAVLLLLADHVSWASSVSPSCLDVLRWGLIWRLALKVGLGVEMKPADMGGSLGLGGGSCPW